jgi:glycine/D-amino acid oxidase-like deaminating enzyme
MHGLTGGGWKRSVGHGRIESCPGETPGRGAETYRRATPPRQPPTLLLRRAGLDRVVLLEKGLLGQGASSRAAGVVRMQGGTPTAVRLGQWSRRFYLGQRDELGIDSGFVAQGYLLPCFTEAEVAAAGERLAMPAALGVPVRWLDPAEVDAANRCR